MSDMNPPRGVATRAPARMTSADLNRAWRGAPEGPARGSVWNCILDAPPPAAVSGGVSGRSQNQHFSGINSRALDSVDLDTLSRGASKQGTALDNLSAKDFGIVDARGRVTGEGELVPGHS